MQLNLGRVFMSCFEAYGQESDLDDAIDATRRAVEDARDIDTHRPEYLTNLAEMLSQS
jgi:hypothetical protein